MNVEGKSMLMTILKSMSPGPRVWDDGTVLMYERGLRNIPDRDCATLADAVNDRFDERPSSAEIQRLWRDLTSGPEETHVQALEAVRSWIKRYGRYGKRGVMGKGGWLPNAYGEGDPEELSRSTPALRSVIEAYGGWIDFLEQWNSSEPMTTKQAQFREMYKAAAMSASKTDMKQLADAHNRIVPLIEQIGAH